MTQKRILIYLGSHQTSWLIMDDNSQPPQSVKHGNLTDLIPFIASYSIHVIVPSQTILLTTAELPKLSSQRVRQALPFTLEEQLIDDVSTLHFALGEYQSNNRLPVAIVTKEKMETWLAELKLANITPDTLIPATLVLPVTPDNWYACIYEEIAIVRTGQNAGFACDKENLALFLELQLAETEQKPACIHLYNFSAAPTTVQLKSTTLNEVMLSEDQFLEYMAKWLDTYPPINLLQGTYQTTKKSTMTKKIWLVASCLALAWASVAFFSPVGSLLILHHGTVTSDQLINKIYQRHFPQASSVVAPKQRMEEKLKKLSVATNKNNFLSLLASIGNSIAKVDNIHLLTIDFRSSQLTLNIVTTTFANLALFTQDLTQQGLLVKQQSASIVGATVKANLLIYQGIL